MIALPPPSSYDDHVLTEYVELVLLVEDEGHLSLSELASRFPSGRRPGSADMGLIRSRVIERSNGLGSVYPFGADDSGVFRLPSAEYGVYDFLLLLSIEAAPYRREGRYNEANRIFDFLVREAVKAWLGLNSRALRFGTPVQDGRPELFGDAIPWLADKMGVAVGVSDLPVDDNDCGVDVVAWKPFQTGRSGMPIWLVQATVQLEYGRKALQIPVELWKQMIGIGPSPDTALAVPFTLREDDDRWMKISLAVNSLLERVRLCELLAGADISAYEECDDMCDFTSSEVDKIRAAIDSFDEGLGDASYRSVARVAKPRRQRPSATRDPLRR